MCSKIKYRSFYKNKDLYLLCFLLFISQVAFGQSGIWTWISGDSTYLAPGVYGTQGFPSTYNHPPGEFEMAEWKDKEGNFWVYGGTFPLSYNDLWKYNPLTNEWTWVKGTASVNQPPTYGKLGIPDPANSPGERSLFAASWVDTSGNFWLFGGGELMGNAYNLKNDLWKYDIGTNNWTWMKGDTTNDSTGVHGLQGSPDSLNIPGGRCLTSSAWTDSLNNLWLFGGFGYDDNGIKGELNDLMKYNISTNEWTWMKGSAYVFAPANYGSKGIAKVNNDPGIRRSYTKWKDSSGNFWIMGGAKINGYGSFNDVWKYDLGLNEWIWMNGDSVSGDTGHYGGYCLFNSSYLPAARAGHSSSVTDNCGRFWTFGGQNDTAALNDLWVFDPSLLQWKWLSGSSEANQKGNYGKLGVPSAGNMPHFGIDGVAWWGNDNRFYLFSTYPNVNSALWVYNPDTTCVSTSCIRPPTAGFQSSKISICANDCIDFTNQSINATSWQWSFAGAADSTSTAQNPQNICYPSPGTYNVTLIVSNSEGSDSVTFSNYINVSPALQKPTINQVGNTLYCTTNPSYTSYQWSFDSVPIAGASDTFLIVSKSGNYTVAVTNENGCKVEVNINIIIGIQNYVSDNIISLYPNPATDQLLISGNWKSATGSMKLIVFNVLGQVIYNEELNTKQETINCKPFPAGVYFVQVANESGRWTGKFVKE